MILFHQGSEDIDKFLSYSKIFVLCLVIALKKLLVAAKIWNILLKKLGYFRQSFQTVILEIQSIRFNSVRNERCLGAVLSSILGCFYIDSYQC